MRDNQPNNSNKPIGISEGKALPALTMLFALGILWVFYSYQSAHSQLWIGQNTFKATAFFDFYAQQKWGDILRTLFVSNLACAELWQVLVSMYFIALFGIPVEKRLGPSRYIVLILLAGSIPWIVQFFDISYGYLWPLPFEHPKNEISIYGPTAIIMAVAGAYLVLTPKKEKDPTKSRLYRKDRMEIFNNAQAKPLAERFGFSPTLFFCGFCVYAIVQRFYMLLVLKESDSIGLFAEITALLIGYVFATFVQFSVQDTYQEHPLKHSAIVQYYELLDLDVSHANAVKGAAKKFGLPDYQVEAWVKQNKGKLRPT